MKVFDHAVSASKDEWLFAFVSRHRGLPAEICGKYARTSAVSSCNTLVGLALKQAGEEWVSEQK